MEEQILRRLAACETANRRLRRVLALQAAVFLLAAWACGVSCASTPAGGSNTSATTLRVSELVVVDRRGIERVRIGGDLPDAIVAGRRVPRRSQAAGILLYDDTGQERSGYVTFSPSGVVGLTLDTRERQVALFAANSDGGAALRLWNAADEIALRADEDGAHVTAVAAKKVVFQEPPISPETSTTCAELRKLKGQIPDPEIFADCAARMREEACRACLSRP